MPWNLISPNRVCAKINLPKFFRNTTLLALANFFPGENFPLYGNIASVLVASGDSNLKVKVVIKN